MKNLPDDLNKWIDEKAMELYGTKDRFTLHNTDEVRYMRRMGKAMAQHLLSESKAEKKISEASKLRKKPTPFSAIALSEETDRSDIGDSPMKVSPVVSELKDEFEKDLDKQTNNFAQDIVKAAYRDGARWATDRMINEDQKALKTFDCLVEIRDLRSENAELKKELSKQMLDTADACLRSANKSVDNQELKEDTQELVEALYKDRYSPRELCALMTEGEGDDPKTYQTMARSAMEQIDKALIKWRKKHGDKK